LVSGNLERAVPRSVVVTGDGAAELEQEPQPPADGARIRRAMSASTAAVHGLRNDLAGGRSRASAVHQQPLAVVRLLPVTAAMTVGEHGSVDLVHGPPGHGRRGDVPEQLRLVPQRRHVNDAAAPAASITAT